MIFSKPLYNHFHIQDVVSHVMSHMTEEGGVHVMRGCEPRRVEHEKGAEGTRKAVTWYNSLEEKTCKVN